MVAKKGPREIKFRIKKKNSEFLKSRRVNF